jgi:hypothetical protein
MLFISKASFSPCFNVQGPQVNVEVSIEQPADNGNRYAVGLVSYPSSVLYCNNAALFVMLEVLVDTYASDSSNLVKNATMIVVGSLLYEGWRIAPRDLHS